MLLSSNRPIALKLMKLQSFFERIVAKNKTKSLKLKLDSDCKYKCDDLRGKIVLDQQVEHQN